MTSCAMLLITVVRRSRGDRVVQLVRSAGAMGSTIFLGKGASGNRLLRMLYLGDTEKEMVLTLSTPERMPALIDALRNAPDLCRKVPGIGFTIDVSNYMKSGTGSPCLSTGAIDMSTGRQLICVIANSGTAYDIMQVARKAGATGGTFLRGRGTASEEDSSFFGITIVPEKDVILILSTESETAQIIDTIRNCEVLSEPGSGIIFTLPVVDFFLLGKQQLNPYA